MKKNGKPNIPKDNPNGKPKRGNPTWHKGMKSPNPNGAPKRGESWREVIKAVGNLTPVEAAEWLASMKMGQELKDFGDKLTMKQLIVVRVFHSLLNDPQPGLFNSVIDHDDVDGAMSHVTLIVGGSKWTPN